MSFTSFFDYTVNGLIIGNIYAMLAVGLALIFGVSHLINFAHGSVYVVGAYIGWVGHHLSCTRRCPVTLRTRSARLSACAGHADRARGAAASAGLGAHRAIAGHHRHQLRARHSVQLLASPDPRALPTQLPNVAPANRRRHDRRCWTC
jgi:branched-chain amino acid transport system permease protein